MNFSLNILSSDSMNKETSSDVQHMFVIIFMVGASGVLKGYVQGAGGPNHYPIYRPLCLLGIDAFIYRDMLK
jgi:hypothetical protein